MPRNSFQDVVPPSNGGRRSIRDIQINRRSGRRSEVVVPPKATVHDVEEELQNIRERQLEKEVENTYEIPNREQEEVETHKLRGYDVSSKFLSVGNRNRSMSKIFISVAGVIIVGFIILMMTVFTSASITINPKKQVATFSAAVNLYKTPSASSTASGLKYEVIELKKTSSREVSANGEEQVERKATGKVVVYNNFSSDPQRLITRTRFETSDGLVYRISDSVVVPGKKGTTPGSIEATVYADEAGEKYNVGMKDFTLPGFKTDAARYKGFYARSKTDMTGGFVGKVKKVADTDKELATKGLKDSLKTDVDKEILAKIPENSVLLNGATLYSYKDLPQEDVSDSKVLLKEEATIYAITLDKTALSDLIKKQFLVSWQDVPAGIQSFDKIALTFDDNTWMPNNSDSIGVKLSGSAEFLADIDAAKISEALAGKSKSELGNIINNSTTIESATAAVRPLWKTSFPEDINKIKIKVNPE